MIKIDDIESYKEFIKFRSDPLVKILEVIESKDRILYVFNTNDKISIKKTLTSQAVYIEGDKFDNDLIFGKDKTRNIVNVAVVDNSMHIFSEVNGQVEEEVRPASYWLMSKNPTRFSERLSGRNYYNYITKYDFRQDFLRDRGMLRNSDIWSVFDEQESNLIMSGITYFKGMKVSDVSVLSFDIETTGKNHNKDSKVLIISNTLRVNGAIEKKLFKYDDYESDAEMIAAWCEWVRDTNPSLIIGHNIFGFDFPYLSYCYKREQHPDDDLKLGRDGSDIRYNNYSSEFRKDGSQTYEYHNAKIFGREIIDTFFLSIKYDLARKYTSYALKSIIREEGLEKADRQHYDAALIGKNYQIPKEWKKIVQYAKDDADDALALFDLMIPAFFYYAQSIPKTLQQIINSATGSQINSFLVRSYLSIGMGLPKASDVPHFEGAISFGIPGVYKNCFKVDVASLYPSIILEHKIYNKHKDPEGHFLKMVEYFTKERLENKQKAKETGNRDYKDFSESQKIVVNSAYGLLGAPGLLFNSPYDAGFITLKGREILDKAIEFATGQKAAYWIAKIEPEKDDADE